MSWDDEDFDIPTNPKVAAAAASWEDELNDEPLLESWDAEEEEKPKKATPAPKKKAAASSKSNVAKKQLDLDNVDEKTRKELLRKAELDSDLNNAADLFGGLGVAGDKAPVESFDVNAHPRERAAQASASKIPSKPVLTKDTPIDEHPLFQPTNKQEFEKLRKAVAPALTGLAKDSQLMYASNLAIDLIRDLTQPLNVEQTRKAISTLNIVLKEKEKAERQARLAKSGGTATGGAGKKKAKPAAKTNVNDSFKKDPFDDMDYNDFDDDDFM